MLNCKIYTVIFICCLFVFAGCIESKYGLDINTTLNEEATNFLVKLPGIKDARYSGMKITANAKSVEVYKATFREATIEKDNLLEFTELNDSSTHPRVNYREIDGFMQELYLLKYRFTYDAGGIKPEATAVVFMSLRYRPMKEDPYIYCTGPGPLYWGIVNEGYISFDSVLNIKGSGDNYYLHTARQKKNRGFNLLFMPADFPDHPERKGGSFNITKIVRIHPNRIGGNKPLVFDIPVIFSDSKALHFDYITTITLNN